MIIHTYMYVCMIAYTHAEAPYIIIILLLLQIDSTSYDSHKVH